MAKRNEEEVLDELFRKRDKTQLMYGAAQKGSKTSSRIYRGLLRLNQRLEELVPAGV